VVFRKAVYLFPCYLLYIIDLPEYIGDNVDCDLFTDDAKLSKHVRGTADAGTLQLGFNRLFDWTSKWLLKFNIIKCV